MIPIDSRDLDPDLRAEYDATCRTMNEIWDARRHLHLTQRENWRAPDTVETHEEEQRLDASEERLAERESACRREQSAIKVKHLQRLLEKIPEMRRRFPDDKHVEEYEQQLRATIHELEGGP